jgi:peptide deformylase
MARYEIRMFGDPVLKQQAKPVAELDGTVVQLASDMYETLAVARGLGLAAPQVGVQKRMFVYELDDGRGPMTVLNPVLSEVRGEWEYSEGCLSVPGLYFPIVRPKEVHLTGYDLEGNEVSLDADELVARLFQHELDHLNGTLLLEHLDSDQRKAAMRELRRRATEGDLVAAHAVRSSGHEREL